MGNSIKADAALLSSLIAYYKLEGNVTDSHGTNHGTAEKTISTVSGILRNCINFDGASGAFNIGTYQTLNLGQILAGINSFSISVWVNLNNTGDYAVPVSISSWAISDHHPETRFHMGHASGTSGNAVIQYYAAGGMLQALSSFNTGTIIHWVFTVDYDSGAGTHTIKFYKNGVIANTASGNIGLPKTSTLPLLIGSKGYGAGTPTQRTNISNGKIDEIAIANRVWTAEEVLKLYHSGYPLRYEEVYVDTLSGTGADLFEIDNLANLEPSYQFVPVTDFEAVPGSEPRQILLSWTNPVHPDFQKVVVRRSEVGFPESPSSGDLVYEGSDETVLDTDLDVSKIYYYSIFSFDIYSSYSEAVTQSCQPRQMPVTSFEGTPGPRQIAMTWVNPTENFVGVTLRRREDTYPTGPTDGVEAYRGALEAFTDEDLDSDKTYYYSIFAFDSVPNYSMGVSGDWQPDVLPAVTDLTAVTGDASGEIDLTWTNPIYDRFDHVVLRRSDTSYPNTPSEGDLAYSGPLQALTDGTLDPSKTYYYSIFAYDEYGAYSARDTASAVSRATRLTGAAGQTSTKVRVTFDHQMTVTGGGGTDALQVTNWVIETSEGSEVNPFSTELYTLDPTVIDITLDGEMTGGATYTITVAGTVTDSHGYLLDPLFRSREFEGFGLAPQVSGAEARNNTSIIITYNESVLGATTSTNYSIPGLTVDYVTLFDEGLHQYRIFTVETQTPGLEYTITVTGVTDLVGNPIDPSHNTATFVGATQNPQVESTPVSVGHTEVVIRFNIRVLHADEITSYSIDPPLDILSAEQYEDVYTYLLVTDPQVPEEDYTLTVSSAVTSLSGTPIDPDHDTVAFEGQISDPPVVSLAYPTSGSRGFSMRDPILITAADPDRLIGIDESTWNVTMTRYLLDETVETLQPLIGGALQPNFMGERSGDPDDPEGVSWRFVPIGWWEPGATYYITSEVYDREGNPNANESVGYFETGVAIYIEDMDDLVQTETDTKILATLALPNSQRLKGQLLLRGSTNRIPLVQARTLLYWASRTEVRNAVLSVTDFSSTSDLRFGDRASVVDLYSYMSNYLGVASRALGELRSVSPEIKDLLSKSLRVPSALHVISSMAAISVLASFEG